MKIYRVIDKCTTPNKDRDVYLQENYTCQKTDKEWETRQDMYCFISVVNTNKHEFLIYTYFFKIVSNSLAQS